MTSPPSAWTNSFLAKLSATPQLSSETTSNPFIFIFLSLPGAPTPRHSAAGMGVLYLSQFPLLLYGAYRLIVDKPKFAPIIWLLLLIAPLPAAITQETPHAIRSLLMLPALTIITA